MEMKEFIEYCREGNPIRSTEKEKGALLFQCSQEAMKITNKLNNKYNTSDEVRKLFEELTGRDIDSSFMCFPPFYTDFGKNIIIGKNVFINMNCNFQDRGGIIIGDGTQIGMNVAISTLNHGFNLDDRDVTYASKVVIGKNVWIGSGVSIVPNVTIGDNSIIASGAVVTKDIPSNVLVGGVPARVIKNI